MYPHGVDPLQFTGPVLRLVFRDVWIAEEEIDRSKGRNIKIVTRRCVEECDEEEKVEDKQTRGMEG